MILDIKHDIKILKVRATDLFRLEVRAICIESVKNINAKIEMLIR